MKVQGSKKGPASCQRQNSGCYCSSTSAQTSNWKAASERLQGVQVWGVITAVLKLQRLMQKNRNYRTSLILQAFQKPRGEIRVCMMQGGRVWGGAHCGSQFKKPCSARWIPGLKPQQWLIREAQASVFANCALALKTYLHIKEFSQPPPSPTLSLVSGRIGKSFLETFRKDLRSRLGFKSRIFIFPLLIRWQCTQIITL